MGGGRIKVIVGDATRGGLEGENSFDAVHVGACMPPSLLGAFALLLKPGGRLVYTEGRGQSTFSGMMIGPQELRYIDRCVIHASSAPWVLCGVLRGGALHGISEPCSLKPCPPQSPNPLDSDEARLDHKPQSPKPQIRRNPGNSKLTKLSSRDEDGMIRPPKSVGLALRMVPIASAEEQQSRRCEFSSRSMS